MSDTVLVLGSSGRFGRHAAEAFWNAGWRVRLFDRRRDDLTGAARGAALIVAGWNPPYDRWAAELPGLTRAVIGAARDSGARVLLPGNVYVFGKDAPPVLGPATPHAARNPLGRLRVEMEAAFAASGVPTLVLRAGDFLDDRPSGNWFDRIIAAKARQGVLSYPGRMDVPHAWAWLPDLARAAVGLAGRLDWQPGVTDIPFPGFTLTGNELAAALARVLGRPVAARPMAWWPVRAATPVWPMARHLTEMRYLWDMPHRLDGTAFAAALPDFRETPPDEALARALSPAASVAA